MPGSPPSPDGCHPCPGAVTDATPKMVIGVAPLPPRYSPFTWQDGARLLMLDRSVTGWATAELAFNDTFGQYDVLRTATYDSPREAAGVLLAAVITADEPIREDLAGQLVAWVDGLPALV